MIHLQTADQAEKQPFPRWTRALYCLFVCLFEYIIFFFQIDFKRPLEQQGPFDVFLHKLTDIIVKAEQDNANDSQEVELFRVLEVWVRRLLFV